MHKLAFAFLLFAPLAAVAQSLVTVSPQQCVWRAGDDPAWAAAHLDESAWQPYTNWKVNSHEPRIWVRCRADLSALRNTPHPALQVSLEAAYQLFLNGKVAGSSGNITSGNYSLDFIRTSPIASSDLVPGPNQLVLRIVYREAGQTDLAQVFAGEASALRDRRDHEAIEGIKGYLIVGICFGIIGVVGFMLFGLYLTDRSRPELLYLALVCCCLAMIRLSEFCGHAMIPMAFIAYRCVNNAGQCLFIPYALFIFRLARKPVPWLIRITVLLYLPALAVDWAETFLPAGASLRVDFFFRSLIDLIIVFGAVIVASPFIAFWRWKSITPRMRPVAFCCMLWGAVDILWFATVSESFTGRPGASFLSQWIVPFLELRAFTTLSVIIALLALLFREQRRVAEERAVLAGEMEAAAEIQRYLIPERLPPTPGLAIHSVYHPAREVGGDFFQVLPDARDRSTLIVVGDVAGKGLKAGMLAALIVGAIRTAFKFTSSPGEILDLLNERLQGRGLVTCLALRIDRNGSVELANAGHLPPYINGRELPVDGALPLGALPDTLFPAKRLQLREGESMVLVSDGVVEARNTQGELFGFERAAAISTEPAQNIARAASTFGQEDDITVLTLTLAPAEVLLA